ncbi:hypothetical protein IEQ34_020044 [Dendrobium chrysotoxum]|uniref:Uncharacterized protein n=1 Tax=Dendrobium chrysotoxum TaxID=161865 RepID=A0AAV7FSV9_DENCH|nr:hypothetical protein IEQ34_020044 [Dendrobium chrysotoxum]
MKDMAENIDMILDGKRNNHKFLRNTHGGITKLKDPLKRLATVGNPSTEIAASAASSSNAKELDQLGFLFDTDRRRKCINWGFLLDVGKRRKFISWGFLLHVDRRRNSISWGACWLDEDERISKGPLDV